jgi:hypothetical protein
MSYFSSLPDPHERIMAFMPDIFPACHRRGNMVLVCRV